VCSSDLHPIYDHLIPQLAKFNKGIEDGATRRKLVDNLYKKFDEDEVLKARLKQKLQTGEIFKFISDLVFEQPLIVVVIDEQTEELEEVVEAIKGDVAVVEFRTFRREGVSDDVNAFVFKPMFKAISTPPRPDHQPKPRGIMQSVFELFDDKGVDNVTYPECESIAREVKPDTKFGKSHFSWYKNKYKRKPEGRGTDRFGSPVGSNQAKINAVLSTEPKTMKTLVDEAGLSGTYYQHFKRLIEKGFVEKTDKGFREIEIVGRKKVIAVSEDVGYSEFWEPIRREGLFKGKPVPIRNETWVTKRVRGILVELILQAHKCLVEVSCKGEDRLERRRNIIRLFPKNEYEYKVHESPKSARVRFPVSDKGKKDREHWPEMRKKLIDLGADIHNKIKESGI
jgi:hypothetical protein